MSSDASQSILRLTLLASATAAFMVVWSGDSSRTVGMTLAERNRQIVPAHALSSHSPSSMLAVKPARPTVRKVHTSSVGPLTNTRPDVESLPAGSYRIVFEDGRVEWLTVIDRSRRPESAPPSVLTTTINGERAHAIRVTSRPGLRTNF